jgi:hypothetical protein
LIFWRWNKHRLTLGAEGTMTISSCVAIKRSPKAPKKLALCATCRFGRCCRPYRVAALPGGHRAGVP